MDFLNLLKPVSHHSKNGFDLSRKHVFSCKAGEAKPCLCIETVPNDVFEIDLASLSRTMTLNTAAFLRGKMRYDFFFVPFSQLWHPFNQFISQRTDKHSSRQLSHNYCPVISLSALLSFLRSLHLSNHAYSMDIFRRYVVPQMTYLLNMLGYGDFRWIYDNPDEESTITAKIAAYDGKYVNVWRLAAYQHIWYDYYRNKYYDVDDTGGIPSVGGPSRVNVNMFNFDDIDCSTFANSVIPCGGISGLTSDEIARIANLLQPRYVQWKKDLFTSSLPGQQFGVVSSVDINIDSYVNGTNSSLNSSTYASVRQSASGAVEGVGAGIYSNFKAVGVSAFDVLSLRKAEMLQLWKQRTLRAGNQVDDNFKAHYGVESYYEGDNVVNYLGSFSSSLQINAVETTAANTAVGAYNKQVGDLAATGTAVVNGKKIRFSPRDFGVIMCIASFLPESEYNASSIEKANTLHEQFDYFTPEFENIGLEAVPLREYDFDSSYAANSEVPIGFAPRYWNYKTAVDKVYGEFENRGLGTSLTAWVAPRSVSVHVSSGSFYQDVANLYVNPNVLNNIFAIRADAFSSTDQFLNNVYFDVKAIRPMSELGLPQF